MLSPAIFPRNAPNSARYAGHCKALRQRHIGIDPAQHVHVIEASAEACYRAVKKLLGRRVELDAIFGAGELIAMDALDALDEADLKIPDGVTVAGFDEIPISASTFLPLTIMRQGTLRAGEFAGGQPAKDN